MPKKNASYGVLFSLVTRYYRAANTGISRKEYFRGKIVFRESLIPDLFSFTSFFPKE